MTILELVLISIGFFFGLGATAWLTVRYDLRKPNFRGERIPSIAGLAFVLAGDFIYGFEWLAGGPASRVFAAYFLVLIGFGILGMYDDLAGDRSVGGFRGHFRALAQGRLTTGAVKALGGGAVALGAGWLIGNGDLWRFALAAALIALSANSLNLLDLRPGRCLFVFFCSAAVLTAVLANVHQLNVGFALFIAVGMAAVIYPMDAAGQAMIGDTGSNSFGAVLGVAASAILPLAWQAVVVVLLIGFQFWCERNSLSKTIEANPFLRGLDRKIGVRR
ncbi:MAG: glycosyl transferase family 4 [Capsulimonas sp.]|jgi:UDP-GlcNAc:undecaprenyl-phosphate GlcNAc-1-phosphate transferase|nr:glycosyl transferase family 4 [Capsulimonas sp.]